MEPRPRLRPGQMQVQTAYRVGLNWDLGRGRLVFAYTRSMTGSNVLRERTGRWQDAAAGELCGWVQPVATFKACLVIASADDKFQGWLDVIRHPRVKHDAGYITDGVGNEVLSLSEARGRMEQEQGALGGGEGRKDAGQNAS